MTIDAEPGPRPSLLFVDDEQPILDGLRNVLRPDRRRWSMRFALGGARALEEMAAAPADVVVTDMRMPGMDGLELLRQVQAAWPDAARVVLSGYADLAAVASAASVAHQYLLKPGDAEILLATAPDARGQGVGSFILDHLESEAHERGINYLYNTVRPTHPDRDRVSAWLRTHGFQANEDGSLFRAAVPRGD